MIEVSCPSCRKVYAVQAKHAGKKTQCKACKATFTIPGLPPVEADVLEVVPEPEREEMFACPHCRAAIPVGTIFCPHCLADPRAPKARRAFAGHGAVPAAGPAGGGGAGARHVKNPVVYVVVGVLALIVILVMSQAAAVVMGVVLVVVGFLVAVIGNLYFGWSMYKAVYQEHGLLPILGLFVPIVSFFVSLWMIITYWHYAWRAVAAVVVGISIMLVGGFMSGGHMPNFGSFAAQESRPVFPALRAPDQVAAGIDRYSIQLGGSGPGTRMRIELYLPTTAKTAAEHSIPCVLIAPAGTSMLTGIRLSDGDSAEHLAYVRHGFAVAAFDLDGALSSNPTNSEFLSAVRAFRQSRYGMTNAHNTIGYLLEKVPAIDPEQLFAVGHSSAGGLALNLAADDHRIKAVVAYAPSTEILSRQPPQLIQGLKRSISDIESFAREASPLTHVREIQCPVFVFHAQDDDVVPSGEIETFVNALRGEGKNVQYRTVSTGGHYQSMIAKGIPQGITWLHEYAPGTTGIAEVTPAPQRSAAVVPPSRAPLPSPSPMIEPNLPRGNPADRAALPRMDPVPRPVAPEVPAVFSYTIPAPAGFTKVESNDPNVYRWTKQKPGRAVQSEYKVTLSKAPPFPERYLPNASTMEAGPLTFRQSRTMAAQFTQTVIFTCRDGECLITLSATRDTSDSDAAAAMTAAAKKIKAGAAPITP